MQRVSLLTLALLAAALASAPSPASLAPHPRPVRCIGGRGQFTFCLESGGSYTPYTTSSAAGGYGHGYGYGYGYTPRVHLYPQAQPSVTVLRPPTPVFGHGYGISYGGYGGQPPVYGGVGYGTSYSTYGTSYGGYRPGYGGYHPSYIPHQPSYVPQYTPQRDIRTFYNRAVLVGRGVVNHDQRTNGAQLICDFTVNGPYPSTDILTDVVWQKVGQSHYINHPMTSIATVPNWLYCPTSYIQRPPTNYGFNIVGTRTALVIKNATPNDYGIYRCYATRVSRLNPADRTPVYMEIYYGPSGAQAAG